MALVITTISLKAPCPALIFFAKLFSIFAIASLVLAASGIYAIVSQSIEARTHELGLRRALGASEQNIVKLLFKSVGWQLAIGLLLGIPLSLLMSQGILNTLGSAPPLAYLVLVAMPILLTAVVWLATWITATKSVAMTPNRSLRHE